MREIGYVAEAGYPNGFTVPMDCPVGTNAEACQAIAAMLARAAIRAQLTVHTDPVFSQRQRRMRCTPPIWATCRSTT